MPAVRVRNLRKVYGPVTAVDDVSLEIEEGAVYALLGQNGAGKSTAVEILEGHRKRDSGEVEVLGLDPAGGGRELRDRIGIVLQSSGIEHEFKVREAIETYGSVYRRRRPIDEVLELAGLEHKVDERVGTLSGGQQRRLDLALGIVGYPEVLFLDEPTTGFDPGARRRAWDVVSNLCTGGTTVLLTTHYLDEAEHLADRVGIISDGAIVAEGSPQELMAGIGVSTITFTLPEGVGSGELDGVLPEDAEVRGNAVRIATPTPTATVHELTSWAVVHDVELTALTIQPPSLEDVYFQFANDERP
ncbi:MAG: ABC transporter ATP-binding protein [Actinomycetota bacterium]|nr:ABC transporter ATP-binding protein [Actinomycetota bacterium]